MRVLLSVDMEGISGIESFEKLHSEDPSDKEEITLLTVEEINNAVEACFEGGADEVLVVDGHGSGGNVNPASANNKAIFLPKSLPYRMLTGIDQKIDYLLFLGYHGRAGVEKSFIAHTNSSIFIDEVRINGRPVGESEINAYLAERFKTKVVFASGTDVGMQEISDSIPGIKTAPVLESIDFYKAKSLPLAEARKLIRDKIVESLKEAHTVGKIESLSLPVTFEVDFKAPYPKNRFKKLEYLNDRKTIRFTEKSYRIAYRNYGRYLRFAIKNMAL